MLKKPWCHFSVRVDRTSLHRKIKEGQLGYEDEKFCYVVLSKTSLCTGLQRIVKTPLKLSGHLRFTLCTNEGLVEKVVSKKEGEGFKKAKKLEWGEIYSVGEF